MTSFRQFEANRGNALHSTGPNTNKGKQRSRLNAVRHGLTAETIVGGLEDAEDYKAFEAAIIADYWAETAVARELVLRLASILWRLRRATSIETDLLELQAEPLPNCGWREILGVGTDAQQCVSLSGSLPTNINHPRSAQGENANGECQARDLDGPNGAFAQRIRGLTHSFLRIASSETGAFERLNRYEARLWRQAVQIIFTPLTRYAQRWALRDTVTLGYRAQNDPPTASLLPNVVTGLMILT